MIWRVFSRGPGRRIPDRLTMSRYVAPPARAIPGVRVIFPEYRAAPGPCGGLIGAGSGSVRAPGVPVPVTVCVLVQVARHGAVAVPHALSHIFSESRGVLRVLRESCAPPGSAFGRLCVPFMPRYGAYLPGSIGPGDPGGPGALSRRDPRRGRVTRRGVTSVTCQGGRSWSGVGVPGGEEDSTRAGDGPAWSDIVPAGAGGHPHISRQYSIVRVKAPPRNVSRSSVMNPCSRAISLKRFPDFPGSAPP